MHVRGWIGATLVSVVMGAGGCAAPRERVNHVVLVTLRDAAERERLVQDTRRMLAGVPGIVDFSVGPPVDTGRTSVDGSYDVGFCAVFESKAALRAYDQDPEHRKLIETWRPSVKQLRIYDFEAR